jgi:hypothetical protein
MARGEELGAVEFITEIAQSSETDLDLVEGANDLS